AKRLERDRTNYSSGTDPVLKLASDFNSDNELKNVILDALRSFAFYTARVKMRRTRSEHNGSALPPSRRRQGESTRELSGSCHWPDFRSPRAEPVRRRFRRRGKGTYRAKLPCDLALSVGGIASL